jgi:hypothetical protein
MEIISGFVKISTTISLNTHIIRECDASIPRGVEEQRVSE